MPHWQLNHVTLSLGEFLETGNPFRKELLAAEMLPGCLLAILWMQLTGKSYGLLLPPQGILNQKKLYGGTG